MVGFYMNKYNSKPSVGRVSVPTHKSLMLVHNAHFTLGKTVEQAIDEGLDGFEDDDWISQEQKQKAIDTGNHWYLRAYPETRDTYYIYSASDVDLLLATVAQLQDWSEGTK